MRVDELLADALAELGGEAGVPDLVRAARRRAGPRLSRAAVERALASSGRFACDDADPRRPRWSLADPASAGSGSAGSAGSPGGPASRTPDRGPDPRGALDALALRDWQVEAFAAWSQAGCRGVVEAVTGTGKTRLAVAVLRSVVGTRTGQGRGLVLVPTLDLLEQWVGELRTALPERRIGRLGGGHDDDLFACDVVVATPHSAAAVPVDLPPGAVGVLIADEAHRYGAPTWAAALRDEFALRLALTATYERGDDGVDDVLAPYFGEVVVSYGFDRAVADGTVAPFRLGLVGVPLTEDERARHGRADLRVKQLHRELVGVHGLSKDPRRRFEAVTAIVGEADRGGGPGTRGAGPLVAACREYLVRVRERRDVAAQAAAKLELCELVAPALAGRRTLVFTDTVDQAEDAARLLRRAGREARSVHGDLASDERRTRLALFRRGDVEVVVAPRVLDEGVDVPDADVAVVLAAFRTRRQLVQRLGRVLRVKSDGREARLLLAHAVGTAEDPAEGGHADFLDDVRPVAREVRELDLVRDPGAVTAFLARP